MTRGRGLVSDAWMMMTFSGASTIMIGVVVVQSRGVPHGRQYVSGSSHPSPRSSGLLPSRAFLYISRAHGCRGGSSSKPVHRHIVFSTTCCHVPVMSCGVLAGCPEV